jgi:hypothetical protein
MGSVLVDAGILTEMLGNDLNEFDVLEPAADRDFDPLAFAAFHALNVGHSTGTNRRDTRKGMSGIVKRPLPLNSRMPRAAFFLLVLIVSSVAFSASADDMLDRDMKEVERIRHREFTAPVTSRTISREELPARLRAQMEKSLSYSFGEYEQMLRALYLVDEPVDDLMKVLLALLQSQVLAYYDPDTDRFYFVSTPPTGMAAAIPEDLFRDSVVMHELVHAMQDQRVDLALLDRSLRDDWDGALALHAVVEGEATLVMMAVMIEHAGVSLDDVVGSDAPMDAALAAVAATPVDSAGAPRYFVESLKFPYIEGLRFVMAAYRRGGWKAVDQLLVDPPRTTREILEPERYFSRGAALAPFVPKWPASAFPDARLGQAHWGMILGSPVSAGSTTGCRSGSIEAAVRRCSSPPSGRAARQHARLPPATRSFSTTTLRLRPWSDGEPRSLPHTEPMRPRSARSSRKDRFDER